MPNPEIVLRSSSVKLKEGLHESAVISWNSYNAEVTSLHIPNSIALSVSNVGQYVVTPERTSVYEIEARFPDGTRTTKSITIEVLPQAVFSYDIKEHLDGKNVSAELYWSVQKANAVALDGQAVQPSGYKSYLIEWPKSLIFKYSDAFGDHKKVIHVAKRNKSAWLLIDAVKILLRPFTFIGYVGKKEYWWSFLFLIMGMVATVLTRVLSVYDCFADLTVFQSRFFISGYKIVFAIHFLMAMLLAKRWKDVCTNPWNILWFLPVILYPLLPVFLKVDESTEVFYSASAIVFAMYLFVMLCVMLSAGTEVTKHKNKYKRIKVW